MNLSTPAKVAIGGAAVLTGLMVLGGSPVVSTYKGLTGRAAIEAMGATLENAGVFRPGLTTYLVTLAFFESRFNNNAVSSIGARSFYQMLPTTARMSIRQLKDIRRATAAAVDLIHRLMTRHDAPGQVVTWADVRAGWKFPTLVDEPNDPDALQNRANFENTLIRLGFPISFADQPVPTGTYPGRDNVLRLLGVRP